MNGNCHLVMGVGVGVGLSIACKNDIASSVVLIAPCIIGSLLPDIDNPNSHIGQLTKPVSTFISLFSGKHGSNHRGLLHDLGIASLLVMLAYMYVPCLIGLAVGIWTHSILDAFTAKGVPFFFVFTVHLGNMKSGSVGSVIFSWMLALSILGFGYAISQGIVPINITLPPV